MSIFRSYQRTLDHRSRRHGLIAKLAQLKERILASLYENRKINKEGKDYRHSRREQRRARRFCARKNRALARAALALHELELSCDGLHGLSAQEVEKLEARLWRRIRHTDTYIYFVVGSVIAGSLWISAIVCFLLDSDSISDMAALVWAIILMLSAIYAMVVWGIMGLGLRLVEHLNLQARAEYRILQVKYPRLVRNSVTGFADCDELLEVADRLLGSRNQQAYNYLRLIRRTGEAS